MWILECQAPYAELILSGRKTIETRSYALPETVRGHPVWILESQQGIPRLPQRVRLDVDPVRLLGQVVFGSSFSYETQEQWNDDRELHQVPFDSHFNFQPSSTLFGWRVDVTMPQMCSVPPRMTIYRYYRSFFVPVFTIPTLDLDGLSGCCVEDVVLFRLVLDSFSNELLEEFWSLDRQSLDVNEVLQKSFQEYQVLCRSVSKRILKVLGASQDDDLFEDSLKIRSFETEEFVFGSNALTLIFSKTEDESWAGLQVFQNDENCLREPWIAIEPVSEPSPPSVLVQLGKPFVSKPSQLRLVHPLFFTQTNLASALIYSQNNSE